MTDNTLIALDRIMLGGLLEKILGWNMFVTSKKSKAMSNAAFINGRNAYIDALLAWHKRLAVRQVELRTKFNHDLIEKFSVNVWDDYSEKEQTFAYVEMREVPDEICFVVLTHLLEYIKSNSEIMATGIKFGIEFYDSSVLYPTLIGREDGEYSLYKRWQMTIDGADYQTLEGIVELLKDAPAIYEKPIDIYSES